jgi:hypothetical protein
VETEEKEGERKGNKEEKSRRKKIWRWKEEGEEMVD